jgi:hypothetical protein
MKTRTPYPRVFHWTTFGGPAARLRAYKARAEWFNEGGRMAPRTWQDEARGTGSWSPRKPWTYTTRPESKWEKPERRWAFEDVDHAGEYLRGVQYADEVVRLNHRGWFCDDPDFGEVYRGIVARRPGGGWMAGYEDGACGPKTAVFDLEDVHEDERDAARAADEMARVDAERNREWCERERREERRRELRAEVATLAADHDAAIRSREGVTRARALASCETERRELAREWAELVD